MERRAHSRLANERTMWRRLTVLVPVLTLACSYDWPEVGPAENQAGAGHSGSGGAWQGGSTQGGAAGAGAAGGAGATGATGGAATGGAGATAGASGAAGAPPVGCGFDAAPEPFRQLDVNGSFEDWSDELPRGWVNAGNGSYGKAEGCDGANALSLTHDSSTQHGVRFTVAGPLEDHNRACILLRGAGRIDGGTPINKSFGVEVLSGSNSVGFVGFSTTEWEQSSLSVQVPEPLTQVQLLVRVADINTDAFATTVEFDAVELWWHPGGCQ